MQMYPNEGGYKEHHYSAVEEACVVKDEHSKGPSMLTKPDHFKHSYGQSHHGYGGHNFGKQHGFGGHGGSHKPGGFSQEYSESWYEEERRANMGSDYRGKHHNSQHHFLQNGGMKHGGYGGHQGHFGPHKEQKYKYSEVYEERTKGAPVWDFKSIRD